MLIRLTGDRERFGRWEVALIAVVLAACSTPNYPPAPRLAATPDYNYVIGPLDTVNIIVWRNPELSMSVPVQPDGKITFPLVEDLPALGEVPTTLPRDFSSTRWRSTSAIRSSPSS